MQTATDVLTRAKARLGTLAERRNDPTLAPNTSDDEQLTGYLEDAIKEVAKQTDRLQTTTTPATVSGQGYVDLPLHIDVIEEAHVYADSTAHEMRLYDGAETARAAQSPDASSGRPKFIGQYGGKLWLHPVPDEEYELQLVCTMNGEYGSSPPADDTEPPTLDDLVALVPPELERALVAYLESEWLVDNNEPEASGEPRARFERDVRKYDSDPRQQRTHDRHYNPLGL